MDFLDVSREKWREVPAGGDVMGRVFSSDLLKASDAELLTHWQRMDESGRVPDHRGWYQVLYCEAFAGRQVVEVGSGLGFDGIHFMRNGAKWVFTDIVKDNLETVRRLVDLHGLSAQADYLWIDKPEALLALQGEFDVVWANGSLHHAPFEIARLESQILLGRLKPGGRWIELFYPYERWVRQGRPDFSEWGKVTDGERTPWAEWYDVERIKRRLFPAATVTILDLQFGGGQYGWVDLAVDGTGSVALPPAAVEKLTRSADVIGLPLVSLHGTVQRQAGGPAFRCSSRIWDYSWAIDIGEAVGKIGEDTASNRKWAIDLEFELGSGAVGFILTAENHDEFLGREVVADARPTLQRVTASTYGASPPPRWLLMRNVAHETASSGTLVSASLRISN